MKRHCDTMMFPCFTISVLFAFLSPVSPFNLSPKPNIILREPSNLNTCQSKVRSSYFGYSLVMRRDSVIVGAPRGQSTSVLQRAINETGMIFSCDLRRGATIVDCEPNIFESRGNIYDERTHVDQMLKGEMRDNQWLGASMDGASSSDQDSLIACAPRMMSEHDKTYYMHGICYFSASSNSTRTQKVQLKPLIAMADQFLAVPGTRMHSPNYIFGEQGISVHMLEGGAGILLGAPGISDWSGSVIRLSPNRRRRMSFDIPTSVVPDPTLWSQQKFSYFGYAVTSGRFFGPTGFEVFAASAPRAKGAHGEVHLFRIEEPTGLMRTPNITIYRTLHGRQMGEYFGYALLAGDFNGDRFADLAVAAPMHAETESYENGVVYVYLNRGRGLLVLQTVLRPGNSRAGSRFGMSVASAGDLNGDGFNDIAVGAPFEGDGAVYIFFGGPSGVAQTPSQRLEAPSRTAGPIESAMFGLAISKGCDTDNNGFADIAIGAPNRDEVYVYKAYPVVRLVARIIPEHNEIEIGANSLSFEACWHLKGSGDNTNQVKTPTNIQIKILLDELHGRLAWESQQKISLNVSASVVDQCASFNCSLNYVPSLVFRPITVVLHYSLIDGIPESGEFCGHCVSVDPSHPNQVQTNMVYGTGCMNDRCVADLHVNLFSVSRQPYVLGTSRSLALECQVANRGETAFLTQLEISLPKDSWFLVVPSNCRRLASDESTDQNHRELICDVVGGGSLLRDATATVHFHVDAASLAVPSVAIGVRVFSAGDERDDEDNRAELRLDVVETSTLQIIGQSSEPQIHDSGDELVHKDILHQMQIQNAGPSMMPEFDLVVLVPMLFKEIADNLIDIKAVIITHNGFNHSWTEPAQRNEPTPRALKPDVRPDSFIGRLPVNRTVFVNCSAVYIECVEVRFSLSNFLVGQTPTVAAVHFSINMRAFDAIREMTQLNVIVLQTEAFLLRRTAFSNSSNVHFISVHNPYTIIRFASPTPIWVFIVATVGGLLFLGGISYLLYRRGFFNRQTLADFRRQLGARSNKDCVDMEPIIFE